MQSEADSVPSSVVDSARVYYNSADAEAFYSSIWGGQHIHVGLYTSDGPADTIAQASVRTVEHMIEVLQSHSKLQPHSRILDLGSGYGGSARHLARACGCDALTCLNLSEVENERNRQMTAAQGLDRSIRVVEGSFESVPFADSSFDVVWSQDAFLHAGDRKLVVAEIARLLDHGGCVVFTDPMMADSADDRLLKPVLERLNLASLASRRWYEDQFATQGFSTAEFVPLTHHMRMHYSRVLRELEDRNDELKQTVSDNYLEKMIAGLKNWISACDHEQLQWGILYFGK